MQNKIWITMVFLFLLGISIVLVGSIKAFGIGAKSVSTSVLVSEEVVDRETAISSIQDQSVILVLGDSLARGTGSEDGLSIVERALIMNGRTDVLTFNLAVEGFRIDGFLETLKDLNVIKGIESAEELFISIGGNDLRQVSRTDFANREAQFETALSNYASRLEEIIDQIFLINPDVKITFLGLYPLSDEPESVYDDQYLVRWNNTTQLILSKNKQLFYLPTFDIFSGNLSVFLSGDGLHPNQSGYEAISKRLLERLR